jgi:DNA repair photolyase
MTILEIQAKSVLIRRPRIDSWFLAGYGMNLYRGCAHACTYCDGQAESYRVEGSFGYDVGVKTGALTLLNRELDPRRHRNPFDRGFVLVGGGVGDSYQPLEEKYRLTRGALELLAAYRYPVHLLTKSTLVLRDLDLLQTINSQTRALVSFSFSSVDPKLSSIFEPGVPSPSERFAAIRRLCSAGIICGMFLMPVIPFISDDVEHITSAISQARSAGASFIIFGGLTLKEGRQKEHFLDTLRRYFPSYLDRYTRIYPGDRWGGANPAYYRELNLRFFQIAASQSLPVRIPVELCLPFVSENALVALVLDQMDYLIKMTGGRTALGNLAYQISKLHTPLRYLPDYSILKKMSPAASSLIQEILVSGTSQQYQDLMRFKTISSQY